MLKRFLKAALAFAVFELFGLAGAQTLFQSNPHVLLPYSGSSGPGQAHTNCLLVNPLNRGNAIHRSLMTPDGVISYPGYIPVDIQNAYNVNGNLGGQAIAVVEAYDLSSSLTDFNAFSNAFNLPNEPSSNPTSSSNQIFQVVYQSGTKPADGQANQWDIQIATDIEWVHALAPGAKIYLVEANSSSNSDLYAATQVAAALPNVKEVCVTWGAAEYSGETSNDTDFTQTGVTYFAASGDSGTTEYPAVSPNMVAVGGTSLTVTQGIYVGETGWSNSGGGISSQESIPDFQLIFENKLSSPDRFSPDCAAVADPTTGVSVYSSVAFQGIGADWEECGGTNLSCCIAAAITNDREFETNTFAVSSDRENWILYSNLMGPFFRDVTSGSSTSGQSCAVGYDLVTGVGTPNGLLPPWASAENNPRETGQGSGTGVGNTTLWTVSENGFMYSPPTIAPDNTVYLANDSNLYALDGFTGGIKWIANIETQVAPAIGPDGTLYQVDSNGVLYALDASSGSIKWMSSIGTNYAATVPAIGSDGTIYFGGGLDNNVYAVDPYGNEKWSVATGGQVFATPAIAPDGTIYIGSGDDKMYAISPSGTIKWTYTTAGQIDAAAAVIPYGGEWAIAFGSTDEHLYFVHDTGVGAWSKQLDFEVTGTPVSDQTGNIWVGTYDKLYRLQKSNGAISNTWSIASTNASGAHQPALASDGTVYVCSYYPSTLYAFSGYSGGEKWSHSLPDNGADNPSIGPDGTVYVNSGLDLIAVGNPLLSAVTAPSSLVGGASGFGDVTLAETSFGNGVTVGLTSSSANLTVPATVSVVPGQSQSQFAISTSPVSVSETDTITATFGAFSQQATVILRPATLKSFYFAPAIITGKYDTTGHIALAANAAAAGDLVNLTSNSTDVIVPASVTVPAGTNVGSFYVRTLAVSTAVKATVSATFDGVRLLAQVTVEPPSISRFFANPTSITGGSNVTGVVQLNAPAGPSGVTISLLSDNSDATVPPTVTIPAGSTGVSFQITTVQPSTGSDESADFSATCSQNSMGISITITLPYMTSFSVTPDTVVGRNRVMGVARLGAPAGTGGVQIYIFSDNAAVTPTAMATVPQGSSGISFPIATSAVSSQVVANLHANSPDNTIYTTVTVNPAPLVSLSATLSAVAGGKAAEGIVTLGGLAGPGGSTVSLSSGSADVSVPSSVTVPAGASAVSFPMTTSPVASSESVTLSATLNSETVNGTITLNSASLSNFYVSPNNITGGQIAHGVVQLTGPAGAAGDRVTLSSNNPNVSVPASVVVSSGSTGASFQIGTVAVGSQQTATLTATFNGGSLQTTLTVNP